MFVHKSKPLAAGLACAAAAMIMGLAATPAQAEGRGYCTEPECKYPVGGIVQKQRDGVNYFYGGSFVESPKLSYIYFIGNDTGQAVSEPVRSSSQYAMRFESPQFKHRFRTKKDHWKWNRRHHGPLELPGLGAGDKYMGP